MTRTDADRGSPDADVAVPAVLAVLVARDGTPWLRECLQSLARQRHPRLGVLAVDLGSTDGSVEVLERALGSERVLHVHPDGGIPVAVRAALDVPAARRADYLLLLHDDTVLSDDAVERMVEAASQVEGVGVVGAKVVDWDDPRILREVGRSTDGFGHPHSPLEDGEMDHGQYDRVREVLFVSWGAMLVSLAAWDRSGGLDERLAPHHSDLDFCWRARLAGFRILVTPLARVRHRAAGDRGERHERHGAPDSRFFRERTAVLTMVKAYRVVSLLWLLPLYAFEGIAKIGFFLLTRRLDDAVQMLRAWAWNLVHLPGTIHRRVRAQSVRRVPDRAIRRFMSPATERLRRALDTVERLLLERREEGEPIEGEAEWRPLRARASSFARAHPVAVAWGLAFAVGFLATRHLVGPGVLEGGVLPSFPASTSGFFAELASGYRTTGLGGDQPASAALGLLGGFTWLLFGSAPLAQKVLLTAGPPLAALAVYRVILRGTGQPVAGVVGAGCYTLSAVVLWAFSEGRLELLGAAIALPLVVGALHEAFDAEPRGGTVHLVVGAGIALALGISFEPGLLLALGVALAVHATTGARRLVVGAARSVAALAVGLGLALPTTVGLVRDPGAALGSTIGDPSFAELARLALGPGPGSWDVAWFLPGAAVVGLSVVSTPLRARANGLALTGTIALLLAWGSAAGHLPSALSNASVYVLLAAVVMVTLVGFGVASLLSGMERQAFGWRQIAAAILTALLMGGLGLQSLRVAVGDWSAAPGRLPPAWPIVGSADGDFRVLWLGRPSGRPFPAPGGDPRGVVAAGEAVVRYGLVDRDGVTALDVGRGQQGPGYAAVEDVLAEVLSESTRHGGALLSPFGVRYLVAGEGDLAPAVTSLLEGQFDLDRIPAGGLLIYENARWQEPEAVLGSATALEVALDGSPLDVAAAAPVPTEPLARMDRGWRGTAEGEGLVRIADQHAEGWRLEGRNLQESSFPAYGWAIGFRAPDGAFSVVFDRAWVRTAQLALLGALWLAALWVTRRPAPR